MLKFNKIKVIIPIVLLVVISIVIVFLCLKKHKNVMVTTVLTPYNILSDVEDSDSFVVNLYVNQKRSYFTDANKIVSSYITSENSEYKLVVDEIIDKEVSVKLKGEKYYLYSFSVTLDNKFASCYSDEIDNAYLEIEYINGIKSRINIGSFSIYKIENDERSNDIAVVSSKTITEWGNNKGFFGIVLGIRNLSNVDIGIDYIEALDVNIDNNDSYKELGSNLDGNESIEDLYSSYPNLDSYNSRVTIERNSVKNVIIPIKFKSNTDIVLGNFGLKISYKKLENGGGIDSNYQDYYLNKFSFYDEYFKVNENNLKYYEYEYK